VKLAEGLTEHKHQRSPKKTAAVIESLFDKQRPVVVCTHRPALPTVLKQLAEHMPSHLTRLLPAKEPYLSPGEVVVCHVANGGKKRVVAVEQFKPFDD
jgi:8-oxo-(d)GTP phosphatase